MVVDISGSTRLAEQHCLAGPAGIESFRRVIADTFNQQISCISNHGGEVVYFSGDALVAYWPDARPDVQPDISPDAWPHADSTTKATPLSHLKDPSCVQKAELCAQQLLVIRHSNRVETDITDIQPPPQVHIGVGYGELHAMRTFNGANSRLILAGSSVVDATEAMTLASAGEIHLSDQAKKRVAKERLTGERLTKERLTSDSVSGEASIELPPETTLKPQADTPESNDPTLFVSPNLHQYLIREHTPYSEAIRHVSCLYFRLYMARESANDAAAYRSILEQAQTIISDQCTGTGNFVVDHQGIVIKVYLGVPNDTYRNNCQRLVTIGQRLSVLAESLNKRWSGGIATGKCFCDILGTEQRMEYVVTGFPMFLAARLCEGSNNALSCSTDVADRLADTHVTEYIRTIRPKGFTHNIRVMAILDTLDPDIRRTDFYGRVQARERLNNALSQTVQDTASVVYITGDAGVGKSTFIDHFLDHIGPRLIPQKIARVYRVANRTSEYTSAFTCWRPVVDECVGAGTASSLISQHFQSGQRVGDADYKEASRQVMDTLLQSLSTHIAERSLIVLEDVHWMDTASWNLLERLVKLRTDLRFICASRPVSEPDELKSIKQSSRFSEINLQGLDTKALISVVNQTLPFGTANDEIIDLIKTKTQGNPFFIREFVKYLEQSGAIEPVQALWVRRRHKTPKSDTISITELIAARIDQLSHYEREVLQACSILQQQIQPDILQWLLNDSLTIDAIEATLESLLYNDYLRISAEAEDSWAFAHDLLRESIYEMLPPSLRVQLHTRAAQYFEHNTTVGINAAQLTYHWSGAEHPKNTIYYGELAARESLRKGACQETVDILSLCLDAWNKNRAIATSTDVIEWFMLRCAAWSQLGNQNQRLIDARKVVQLAGHPYPQSDRQLAVKSVTKLTRRAIAHHLRRPPAPIPENQHRKTLAHVIRAHRHATYAGFFLRTPLDALYNSLCAVALAESLNDKPQLAGGYAELGGFLGVVGLRKTGYRYLDKAKKLGTEIEDLASSAHVYMSDALFSVGMGNWARSEESAILCCEAALLANDQPQWCTARTIDFWRTFYQGHLTEALEIARSNEVDSRDARHYLLQLWAIHHQILCLLYLKRPAKALAEFSKIDRIYIRDWTVTEDLPTQALRVLCLHHCGDEEDAFSLYQSVLSIVKSEQMTARHSQLEIYSAVLEYHFLAKPFYHDNELWLNEAQQLLKTLKKFSRLFPIGKSRLYYWQATLASVEKNERKSEHLMSKAQIHAENLGLANDLSQLNNYRKKKKTG